jgi:hypothetical protein
MKLRAAVKRSIRSRTGSSVCMPPSFQPLPRAGQNTPPGTACYASSAAAHPAAAHQPARLPIQSSTKLLPERPVTNRLVTISPAGRHAGVKIGVGQVLPGHHGRLAFASMLTE